MNNNINAVLVRLSISMFSNSRQDRAITDEVKLKKALGVGAGKWVKYKLPDECLDAIRKKATEVRTFHYERTSPWEEGVRILSAAARPDYTEGMELFKHQFWQLVDLFGDEYPTWIERAKEMHATTFDPADYPEWNACRAMFGIGTEFSPVPKAEHFDAEMKKLFGDGLEAATTQKIEQAVKDTWERLIKPVKAMADKLADDSEKVIFRDSLVENIREIVEMVPMLNLTGNAQLIVAAQQIEATLGKLDPATLRTSKVQRKEAADKAASIVARFGQFGQRKLAA